MSIQTIALVAVAASFALVILWRVRPALGAGGAGYTKALRGAQARVEKAKDDAEKAAALCDAADACALAFGRTEAAVSYYLRAARVAPLSSEILERALTGLAKKPRALETFLWRRMAHAEFAKEPLELQVRTLESLADVYAQGRKAIRPRAESLRHLAAALASGKRGKSGKSES